MSNCCIDCGCLRPKHTDTIYYNDEPEQLSAQMQSARESRLQYDARERRPLNGRRQALPISRAIGQPRTPHIIQRRPTNPNSRFSVRLAQRQYMLVNTVTAHIRVIPRLAIFDQIRRLPVHVSRLTRIPAQASQYYTRSLDSRHCETANVCVVRARARAQIRVRRCDIPLRS